jgi:hypothetical protein
MDRPPQHIISERSKRIFIYSIPETWVTREQGTDDYGIDYEIEIFNETGQSSSETTGKIVKVQLKGTEKITFVKGKKVAFSLELNRINYLLNEIEIPAFLVVCDLETRKNFWICLQTTQGLRERLAYALTEKDEQEKLKGKKVEKELTIHLDGNTNLGEDIANGNFFQEYLKAQTFLASRVIVNSTVHNFKESTKDLKTDDLLKGFNEKVDLLKQRKIRESFDSNNIEELEKTIQSVLISRDADPSTKFFAAINIEGLIIKKTHKPIGREGSYSAGKFWADTFGTIRTIIDEQYQITQKEYFKIYSDFLEIISELFIKTDEDFFISLNLKLHFEKPNSELYNIMWLVNLSKDYIQLNKEIIQLINNVQELIGDVISKNYFTILLSMITVFIRSVTIYIQKLKNFNENDSILKSLQNYLLELAEFGSLLSDIDNDEYIKCYLEIMKYFVYSPTNVKELNTVEEEIISRLNLVKEESIRENFKSSFTGMIDKNKKKFKNLDGKSTVEEEILLARTIVEKMGFDFNRTDAEAEDIKFGLEDINPERVLRNCKYLYCWVEQTTPMGKALHIPTIGFKSVSCLKYGYMPELPGRKGVNFAHPSLDLMYGVFSHSFCRSCNSCIPHPENWKWSREWQRNEDKKFRKKQEERRKNLKIV